MMDIKTGTQTRPKAVEGGVRHSNNVHTNSATDEEKVFSNGENLGETLNKVADPNWVDPAKKPRAVGNSELGKDAFMTLLLTQMKNQDPTNPLKSHEMAAQLAQFTSLEKLTNIDQGIEKLRTDTKPDKNFEALAMIGKTVVTDSSKISRLDNKSSHDIRFKLAGNAVKTIVHIKDGKGNMVRSLEFPNLKEGKNNLTWNGQMEDGSPAPAGDYLIEVEAHGSNGSKIFAQSKAQGVITGINFTPHGPQVLIGKDAIDLSDIKSISETSPELQSLPVPGIPLPGFTQNAQPGSISPLPSVPSPLPMPRDDSQAAAAPQPPQRHTMEVKPETRSGGAKRARLAQGSIEDAKMPPAFYKKLQKQGVGGGA